MAAQETQVENIARRLQDAQDKEIIRTWQQHEPDRGVRWTVEGFGFKSRVFQTHEVLIFLLGVEEAYLACRVYLSVN